MVSTSNPPRVYIRAGPLRFTATEAEAVALATQLADAIAELRAANHNRNNATKENQP